MRFVDPDGKDLETVFKQVEQFVANAITQALADAWSRLGGGGNSVVVGTRPIDRLVFSLSAESLTAYAGDTQIATSPASSNPSRPATPEKTLTMPGEKNYYPTSFPKGNWNVTGVVDKHNKRFGLYFIATNAQQVVPIYKKDRDGSWSTTDETTVDIGYGIHGGGYSSNPQQENNYTDTTWGCIRLPNGQLIFFADLIQNSLNQQKSVRLQVID